MKNTHLILLLLASLSACSSTKNVAPVEERQAGSRVVEPVKPVTAVVTSQRAPDAHGYYTVKKGDTLIHIALNYGQNYRDLVVWNNLANPNDIKVDQTLRVLPPESGLTNGSVAVQAVPQPSLNNNEVRGNTSVAQVVVNKNWPNGEKRPYSDNALAEMQKNDAPVLAKAETKKVVVKEGGASSATSATAATGGAITTAVAVSNTPAVAPASTVSASQLSAEDERLTWIWPVEGKVIANFEEGKNKGIDIAGRSGQQVLAAGSGKVMYAGSGIRGYGNLVIVKHSNSLLSAYAHNQTILVKEGQSVSRGQTIAEMGSSDSESVKLHFEIRQQGKPVDPTRFLPSK